MQQSKLLYPYSYGDELIRKTVRLNRNKMLTILLLISPLKIIEVKTSSLPVTNEFTQTYLFVEEENLVLTPLDIK